MFPILLSQEKFNPNQISGLTRWFDASDNSTIALSTNNVTQWNDKSPFSSNVSQSNGSNQPLYNSQTQNGLNVITFSGNQFLQGLFPSVDLVTTFAVMHFNAGTSTQGAIDLSNGVSTNTGLTSVYQVPSSNGLFANVDTVSNFAQPTVVQSVPISLIYSFLMDGANVSLIKNGITEDTVTASVFSNSLTTINLGSLLDVSGSYLLNGWIGEVLIYNRTLIASEIATIISYLNNKWSIF